MRALCFVETPAHFFRVFGQLAALRGLPRTCQQDITWQLTKLERIRKMKIHQLSIFVENKRGRLRPPCEVLAHAGINIITLSLADTHLYGILRLIVPDWQHAKEVLEQAGFVVNVAKVLAIEIPDHSGGLAEVLRAIEQAGINVEYMYAFSERRNDRAMLVFRFEDADAALAALSGCDLKLVSNLELFERPA